MTDDKETLAAQLPDWLDAITEQINERLMHDRLEEHSRALATHIMDDMSDYPPYAVAGVGFFVASILAAHYDMTDEGAHEALRAFLAKARRELRGET